jgi:hypothetical protein
MKLPAYFLVCLLILPGYVLAQHALVGTWELISISGINADGERFFQDTTSVRETKVITPTHYFLIARDVVGDSLVFNRAYAGTVSVTERNYLEKPLLSSMQIVDHVETYFTWKLDDDRFLQSGYIVRPDGKKVIVELLFRKVRTLRSYHRNVAEGTWAYVSGAITTPEGRILTSAAPDVNGLTVVSPTHWMTITYRNNRFESAHGGTYSLRKNKMYPLLHYSSENMAAPLKFEVTLAPEGKTLKMKGVLIDASGRKTTWEETCNQVGK